MRDRDRERIKKQRQRARSERGIRVLQSVEIVDWKAWEEILREGGWLFGSVVNDRSVGDATRSYIWNLCRQHNSKKATLQLAELRSPVTGLIDRETEPSQDWPLLESKDFQCPIEIDPGATAEVDDALDPRVATALIREGGFQIRDE
jgi:hypothetical protein